MIHVLTKIGKRPGWYQVDTPYQTSSTQGTYDETVPWEGVRWYRSPAQGRGVQLDASGQGIPNSFYGITEGAERLQIPTQVFRHFLGIFPSLRGIPINTARVIVVNGGFFRGL